MLHFTVSLQRYCIDTKGSCVCSSLTPYRELSVNFLTSVGAESAAEPVDYMRGLRMTSKRRLAKVIKKR